MPPSRWRRVLEESSRHDAGDLAGGEDSAAGVARVDSVGFFDVDRYVVVCAVLWALIRMATDVLHEHCC